jgi:hypothetical protein
MAQTEKATPDWERVEADYRAGLLSVREIAVSQGVSHTAIGNRARKEGWTRDLRAKVKAKADSLVAKREVAKQVAAANVETERQLVNATAQVIADVRMTHRTDILRFRRLVLDLLAELEAETGNPGLFDELGELLRSEDDKGQDKRNDIYRKVITSASRIDSMKKLADTLKTLIGLEREAYSITDDRVTDGADKAELLKELAALLPD